MPSLLRTLANVGFLSVFVFMFAFPAWGQDTTEVESSRNGNIGFVSVREDDNEIFEMRPDGSAVTQITHNTAVTDLSPAWSPDGKKIAFTSHQPGALNFDIYVMNADGTNPKRITTSPDGEFDPTWSPDGKKIAFERDQPAGGDKIIIMNADGSDQHQLLPGRIASEVGPDWSPDGKEIAFVRSDTGGDQIYTVNINGTDPNQLTQDDSAKGFPEWSPDGSKILFSQFFGTSLADVYVMNADGSDVENLTNSPKAQDGDATWSPDGKQIAFVRGECFSVSQNPCEIWRMMADGSSPTQITPNDTGDNFSPDWLPFGAGVIAQGNADDTGPDGGSGDNTGPSQANTDETETEGNGPATDSQSDNADGTNEPGSVNDAGGVIDDTTSRKTLPNTGGAAILAPAVGLLLISGAVARLVVRRR